MFSLSSMPSTTAVLSTYTTFAASAVLVRTVINEVQNVSNQIIPKVFREKIMSKLGILVGDFSSNMCIYINETNGLSNNEVFEAADIYLRTRIAPSINQFKVSKEPREKHLSIAINNGQEAIDTFDGLILKWKYICTESQKTSSEDGYFSSENVERKSYELSFDKKYRDTVLNSYIPFVLERSKAIKEERRGVKLYALGNYHGGEYDGGPWGSVNFDHPSTFDTLAMNPTVKQELIEDLTRFVRRRSFYKRVGKAWKRGYLLYGPPGTGKSSLIAAMANFLKFDIYDLELASLHSNAELRRLIVSTKNRSILVIEDIDCSIDLENREDGGSSSNTKAKQLTLSGLLNFIDGLWSSCGDEKIIVFTTNHKDRLDPALIRPGRMDMHVHMSYCTFDGFKILVSNYLEIKSHFRFSEIEKLIANVNVTPAEIAEQLMRSEKVEIAMENVVKLLCKKRDESVGKDEGIKGGGEEEIKEECEKEVIGKKRKAKRGRRRQ